MSCDIHFPTNLACWSVVFLHHLSLSDMTKPSAIRLRTHTNFEKKCSKMVNSFRYYRALESVSIASALSTALTIYPRQIRVHQRWQSKLQLLTARKKEWRPATADSSPHAVTCQHCDTHYFSRPRTRNPIRSLVDCWSDALPVGPVPPTHRTPHT